MELALRIFALTALASFSILAIIAMFTLRNASVFIQDARDSLKELSRDIKELKNKLTSSLDDLTGLKGQVSETLTEFNKLQGKLINAVDDLRDMKDETLSLMKSAEDSFKDFKVAVNRIEEQAEKITSIVKPFNDLSNYLYKKIAPPLIETANIVSATSKAVSVFASVLSRKKGK